MLAIPAPTGTLEAAPATGGRTTQGCSVWALTLTELPVHSCTWAQWEGVGPSPLWGRTFWAPSDSHPKFSKSRALHTIKFSEDLEKTAADFYSLKIPK